MDIDKPKWISVKERLPSNGELVIIRNYIYKAKAAMYMEDHPFCKNTFWDTDDGCRSFPDTEYWYPFPTIN